MKKIKCEHCGNENFKESYIEIMPENGIDDIQYSEYSGNALVEIELRECKHCGELHQIKKI